MIERLLSWLNNASSEEREEKMEAEKKIEEAKESLDRSIERGKDCSEKLKRSAAKQVAEANVAIATIRGLLTLLRDAEEDNE